MAKNTTSNPKAKKVRALWSNPSFTTIFCDLCVEEIEVGNGKKNVLPLVLVGTIWCPNSMMWLVKTMIRIS